MKISTSSLLITAMLSPMVHAATTWKIDEEMRFNFTYSSQGEATSERGNRASEPLLKHIAEYKPDIDNIIYKGLLDLGFPIQKKKDPEALRYLLKLYEFPEALDHTQSVSAVIHPFALEGLPGGSEISSFLKSRENLAVKFAVVDKKEHGPYTQTKPLRPFLLPSLPPAQIQAQFDKNIPFTSLYLQPKVTTNRTDTDEQRAEESTSGVGSFHQELLKHYKNRFVELKGNSSSHYFAQSKVCVDEPRIICGLEVIEVPKAVLKFSDYKNLSMPQNPKKMFLTSLLLLKRSTVYARDLNISDRDLGKKDIDHFYEKGKLVSSQLLEIASVVKF